MKPPPTPPPPPPPICLLTTREVENSSSPTPGPSGLTDKGKGKETARCQGKHLIKPIILDVGGAGTEDLARPAAVMGDELGDAGHDSAGAETETQGCMTRQGRRLTLELRWEVMEQVGPAMKWRWQLPWIRLWVLQV
jgi:hypothetical protein